MTTSNKKRRYMNGARIDYQQPRKRFKGHHSNYNIRSNRSYRSNSNNAELSQSQSEGDDNDDIDDNYPQRAMSQIVYHDSEEIEFEFKQCLALYSMAPKHKSTKQNSKLTHIMSQVVSGKYGTRNYNNSNRNNRHHNNRKFIKKSKNNPWDRKMIDFLSNIQSVMRITQESHEDIQQIEEKAASQSTLWVNASLAINVSVRVYSDRVDNLRKRVHNLLSIISQTKTNKNTNKRKTRNINKTSSRRKKERCVSSHDMQKINCATANYSDIKAKYMLDKFNIIRQTSNLLLSSTEWWLDKTSPWKCVENTQITQNNEHHYCDMLLNDTNIDIDFNSLPILDDDALKFFHKNTNNESVHDANSPHFDEERLNTIHIHNRNHNNIACDENNNEDSDSNIGCIPFPNAPIELIINRRSASPLICNRISTTPDSLRDTDDDKEEEKADTLEPSCSASTFNTNPDKNDHDSEKVARPQTHCFKIPKLRRLTRTCCDMSIMPHLLLDEECLDAFIIEHNVPQSSTRKRRKRKRKRMKSINTESPSKRRKICTNIDSIQSISPLAIMDHNELNNDASLDSMDTVQSIRNMVECARGSMQDNMLYEDNISLEGLRGSITYVDEYSVAPSTPKTSVSVPLLTPSTIYSENGCNDHRAQSVLSGVMEVEHSHEMNLNCVWDINDTDPLNTLSPLQIQFESERNGICTNSSNLQTEHEINTNESDFMQNVFNGSEIRTLNNCTYDILWDNVQNNDDEDEIQMRFCTLLQSQEASLCGEIENVSVAMRFLSLLTVSSDSYDAKRENECKLDVFMNREDAINPMGDFVVNISKRSCSPNQC